MRERTRLWALGQTKEVQSRIQGQMVRLPPFVEWSELKISRNRFAPQIDNPAYKGVWAPRKIDNPDYFEDKNPYTLNPIAGVAFEWWTMQDGILVDNVSTIVDLGFRSSTDVQLRRFTLEIPKRMLVTLPLPPSM